MSHSKAMKAMDTPGHRTRLSQATLQFKNVFRKRPMINQCDVVERELRDTEKFSPAPKINKRTGFPTEATLCPGR